VTSFTIKGNSILQTSVLKIVLEYEDTLEQYSARWLLIVTISGRELIRDKSKVEQT